MEILPIEDDSRVQRWLRLRLESRGHRVVTKTGVPSPVFLLRRPFDLLWLE